MAQSETASVPSFMDSVSRLGEATEPQSRWSRPMARGALDTHLIRDEVVEPIAAALCSRSPRPNQQMRARESPGSRRRVCRNRSRRRRGLRGWRGRRGSNCGGAGCSRRRLWGRASRSGFVGDVDVARGHPKVRHQRKGPRPRQNCVADVGGDEAGEGEGVFEALRSKARWRMLLP